MTRGQIKAAADWLSELESHGIYMEVALDELLPFGITYKRKSKALYTGDGSKVHAPVYTGMQHRRAIKKRGLGGRITPGDWKGFTGWELAIALCHLFDVQFDRKLGRGLQFEACLKALYQAASGEEGKHEAGDTAGGQVRIQHQPSRGTDSLKGE